MPFTKVTWSGLNFHFLNIVLIQQTHRPPGCGFLIDVNENLEKITWFVAFSSMIQSIHTITLCASVCISLKRKYKNFAVSRNDIWRHSPAQIVVTDSLRIYGITFLTPGVGRSSKNIFLFSLRPTESNLKRSP